MNALPFTCPKMGCDFVESPQDGERCPYYCSCGQVILSTTVVDYIDPFIDQDGKRAELVRQMISEAWHQNDMSPYINAVSFDRRLAEQERGPSWHKRLFVFWRKAT